MAATYHHARRLYIGTTAERAVVVLDVDGIGTDYWDTDVGVLYIWDGTAWVAGFSSELLGEMLFTRADGLLLLGPDGEITPASWWSLRKQMATLSGAFHQEAGRWQGTRGLMVEEATTNLLVNPSFEVNVIDGWTLVNGARQRNINRYYVGVASCRITAHAAANSYQQSGAIVVADGESVAIQCRCLRPSATSTGDLVLRDTTNNVNRDSQVASEVGTWEYLDATWTNDTGFNANIVVRLRNTTADGATNIFYDAVQMEHDQVHSTSYCDGTLGTGYAWTGVAHNSTSTRTGNSISLTAHVGLLNDNATLSFRAIIQAPYDHDGTWQGANAFVFDYRGATDNDRVVLSFRPSEDKWRIYINGTLEYADEVAFSAGDWIDLVLTLDFTADDYNLYANGELIYNDDTAHTAPTAIVAWFLGSDYLGTTNRGSFVHSEYAVFDRVLTADEAANLYAFQRPLVDSGALDSPSPMMDGLYGYEKIGGFLYWEGMVMAGGEIEVIPDAAGDVAYGVYAMCIATDRGANTVQGTYQIDTPGAGSNTTGIYLALPDSVVLRLYSTGRLTIDEIAGVASIYVNLWLIWQ